METNKTIGLSKIEIAKLLKTLNTALPEEAYQETKNHLVTICIDSDVKEIDRAIEGLSEEDEFALMCYMMETATHLAPLEQRPLIKGDYIVPDFLASFQIGLNATNEQVQHLKYFVDVKSTSKDKFKIGGSQLKRRRNFADQFNLNLLFAVRFTNFPRFPSWALVEDSDRTKTSITVEFTNIMNGCRQRIWNDYWFSLRQKDVLFRAVFTQEDGILRYKDYGNLIQFDILVDGLVLSCDDMLKATLRYIFFEEMSEEAIVTKEGEATVQILEPRPYLRSVSDMLYRFNKLGRDNNSTPSAAPKILLRSDQDNQSLINRNLVESLVQPLLKTTLLKPFRSINTVQLDKVEHDGWHEVVVHY